MQKTITELQVELSKKDKSLKKVKARNSTLMQEVLDARRHKKALIGQYERVVAEWKKNYTNLIENGWKIVIVKVIQKYNRIKGR